MFRALALVLVLAGSAAPARAALVLGFQDGAMTSSPDNPITVGFSFTANQTVTVDGLADFNPGTGQEVRLYDGAGNVLARAVVRSTDPTDGAAANNGSGPQTFNVVDITPVVLSAGTAYYVAADVPAFNVTGLYFLSTLQNVTTDPRINYGHGVFAGGTGRTPTTDGFGGIFGNGYVGPNLRLSPQAVPEPTTLALAGAGLVGLAARRLRRPAA